MAVPVSTADCTMATISAVLAAPRRTSRSTHIAWASAIPIIASRASNAVSTTRRGMRLRSGGMAVMAEVTLAATLCRWDVWEAAGH